jgi:hypothetical protein
MEDVEAGDQLRREIVAFRRGKPYGRFPRALYAKAKRYATERRRGGTSVGKIAAELGVRPVTARAWCEEGVAEKHDRIEGGDSISLVPLVVCADAAAKLELQFPDGTRCHASGVTAPLLAQVIEALRRPR